MRPILFLYLLAFYILVQFCWWAYLLIDLNAEVFEHRIENVRLKSESKESQEKEIAYLEKKIKQRRWMVIGEGSVFLILLVWGSYHSIKAFKKEVDLARQQKNFLLSITHEFKSPLASIKLYLQTILRHNLDRDKEISFINNAISDTERLNNLVENALLANLINHKGYNFDREEINLSAFVRLIVQKFQNVPNHEKITSHIEDGIYILGDKNAFHLLLSNLIENAWKYSPQEKSIVVDLEKTADGIKLCVSDQGVGIPDEFKNKIFQKFFRIGNEETRKSKGTGLGLFIVKHIVEGHEGKIFVLDNKPQGTVICAEFKSKLS
ncbi:MAG: HAMP domain-containing histidine kinase [Bacteroidetes bacterium]|nr:MAG: HAMP domain-containing histidine kinase [Bacteroidota bacterium]